MSIETSEENRTLGYAVRRGRGGKPRKVHKRDCYHLNRKDVDPDRIKGPLPPEELTLRPDFCDNCWPEER